MPHKCILVVDDHPEIRELLRDILEDRGYRVVEACNGRAALEALRRGPIDLVLTDLIMPEVEGIETITAMRRQWPGLGIVAISGAGEGCYLRAARLLGACETVCKPFSTATIVGIVERLLAKPRDNEILPSSR